MTAAAVRIPRLPVIGWDLWRGPRDAEMPTMLDLPGVRFTTSGRASILLALESLGVAAGASVLLPTYHCPTMVAPVVALGGRPVFYPIDAQGTPDFAWLDQQPLHDTPIMLAAHFFGLPQPMASIRGWCDAHGIALIEDCAHSLFGVSDGRPMGTWGDVSIGSLTKFLPVPEGGCLVARHRDAATGLHAGGLKRDLRAVLDMAEEGARHERLPGINRLLVWPLAAVRRVRDFGTPRVETAVAPPEDPSTVMAIDATAAHRQLPAPCRWIAQRVPRRRITERRRRHYEMLVEALRGHHGFRPLKPVLPRSCAPYVFPLWVDEPDPGYQELRRMQVPVFRWDRLWPGVPAIANDQGLAWSHHVIQLACHQDLNDSQLDHIAATVIRLFSRPRPTTTPNPDR